MDDLTTRALQNQSNANANYNRKQQREERQKALTEAPAFITGFVDGKYQLERLGQDPVAVGVPMTNGLLEVGRRTTTTGQYVDGITRVKPVVPVVKPVEVGGKIKYLYTVIDADGQTLLYVGGWKRQPVLVSTFAPGELAAANLDNLGGDRWRVDCIIVADNAFQFQTFESGRESTAIAIPQPEPVSFKVYGYGLATISRSLEIISNVPADLTQNPAYGSQEATLTGVFVVSGDVRTSSGSFTYSIEIEVLYDENLQLLGTKTTQIFNRSESPIPLTNAFSYTESSAATGIEYSPAVIGEGSLSATAYSVALYRSNGKQSIGLLTTLSGQAVVGVPCWIDDSIQPASSTTFDFLGALDVQDNGFTRFELKPFTEVIREQMVAVEQYDKTFVKKAATVKAKVFAPPLGSQPFSPSYHA